MVKALNDSAIVRKGGTILGFLLCFLFSGNAIFAQAESGASNEKRMGRSVAEWIEYVESIGKQDSKPWIAEVNLETDSLLHDFKDKSSQLSKEEWGALLTAKNTGWLPREIVLKIFQLEEVDSLEFADHARFSTQVIWVPKEGQAPTNEIIMVIVNPSEVDWTTRVHYFQKGCYLGFQDVYHKYGIRAGNFADGKGVEGLFHNVNQESGTGVWQHALMFYSAANGHLIPAGWLLEKVNLANPCVYNRQLESKIVSYNPLTVRYEWTIELGYRYRGNQPTFKGKTDVVYTSNLETGVLEPQFKQPNLNGEKLLAFDLGASKKLFVHAWNKELLAILKRKDSIQRRAVIEYLEDEYSE
jgi:hypothetical protein